MPHNAQPWKHSTKAEQAIAKQVDRVLEVGPDEFAWARAGRLQGWNGRLKDVQSRHHDLPGRGVPNGHGGSNMLPESQQPLQRPPCLKLWSGHRRLGQQLFVQLRRPVIAPQLTHLDGMGIPSAPTMQDQQSYIWSMLLTSEGGIIIRTACSPIPIQPGIIIGGWLPLSRSRALHELFWRVGPQSWFVTGS
jgi:hypothetical protein